MLKCIVWLLFYNFYNFNILIFYIKYNVLVVCIPLYLNLHDDGDLSLKHAQWYKLTYGF